MKKLFFLLSISLLISFTSMNNNENQEEKIVSISGKIINYNQKKSEVKLFVNRPGLNQLEIITKIDSLGNFKSSFKSYTPTDIWISYKTNFLILSHPGDNINIAFDGQANERATILKTIKFSGDAAKTNQDAAKLQEIYYSNELFKNHDANQIAIKDLDVIDYIAYLDTLKVKTDKLYNEFLSNHSPNNETKIWAKWFVNKEYYKALATYPDRHRMENNLKKSDWDVPSSYYNPLIENNSIDESALISGASISSFTSYYLHSYAFREVADQWYAMKKSGRKINLDSLRIYNTIKNTPNNLIRQITLTELFNLHLQANQVSMYENNKDVINKYISKPFLKKPLLKLYNEVKHRTENPKIEEGTLLKKIRNSPVSDIMDNIISKNKGKVIYIDYWATWCAPCKSQMPNSKLLKEKLKNKDVSFVYICIDSKENEWKATLDELNLNGQHFFLTEEQSDNIRELFNIKGIPYYSLYDKEGKMVDKGNHLIPQEVKEQIESLLN